MTTVSISQLKTSPAKIVAESLEYPVAVEKRNKVEAYLLGKNLYDKLIAYIENYIDKKAVKETDFRQGKEFEKVASALGI